MNVLLIGGSGSLINSLIVKFKKEGHRIFLLTGDRYKKRKSRKTLWWAWRSPSYPWVWEENASAHGGNWWNRPCLQGTDDGTGWKWQPEIIMRLFWRKWLYAVGEGQKKSHGRGVAWIHRWKFDSVKRCLRPNGILTLILWWWIN